eukprot:scaffold439870_cov18-Prasinocladus_malaysianus.AAC.1
MQAVRSTLWVHACQITRPETHDFECRAVAHARSPVGTISSSSSINLKYAVGVPNSVRSHRLFATDTTPGSGAFKIERGSCGKECHHLITQESCGQVVESDSDASDIRQSKL